MAQNITLLGASYTDVPSILLPKTGGGTASFTDVTGTTATASDVASGKVFFASDGTQTTGTASGGTSAWTKIAETSVTVSTTETSYVNVTTWDTGNTSIWTSSSFVWVRVRDTAGKRAGYWYGIDVFFVNRYPINGDTETNTSLTGRFTYHYTADSKFYANNVLYGVFPDIVYSNGKIRIRSRYSDTYTLTIDGTYSIECYLLTPPLAIFT